MTSTTLVTVAATLLAVVFLLLLYTLIHLRKSLSEKHARIEELEEKVEWLRKIHAENEYKKDKTIGELEKENLELRHKVETLEQKLKEGGKNQIVSQIESYRKRRENRLRELSQET